MEKPTASEPSGTLDCYQAPDVDEQFKQLILTNSVASAVMRLTSRGVGDYTEMQAMRLLAVMLGESNARLVKQVTELKGICPQIIEGDGVRHRWDAPDEFVPVTRV